MDGRGAGPFERSDVIGVKNYLGMLLWRAIQIGMIGSFYTTVGVSVFVYTLAGVVLK